MMTRRTSSLLLGAIAMSAISTAPLLAQESGIKALKERERKVKRVVRDSIAATVAIEGTETPASGSGVIVSSDGLILTAAHVTAAAGQELRVTFPDGRSVTAKSLGANGSRDAGMAQITEKGDWPYVEIGDADKVELGEWCVALGHPGGYDPNRTPPVRLGRIWTKGWTKGFLGMLGSDCTLVGGDSGGPLFDLDGKLIGIHSSIGGQLSENRHVPMDAYKDDWDDLLGGRLWGNQEVMMGRINPNRPAIGVRLDPEFEDGARVESVSDPSPARDAGIEPGDIIRKVGGKKVTEMSDVGNFLKKRKVGQKVKIGVERGAESLELEVELARLGKFLELDRVPRAKEPEEQPARARPSLGVQLERDAQGAKVYEVIPGSAAAKAGIEAGDVVLEIDGDKIKSAAEMAQNIGGRKPGDKLSMLLRRGDAEKELEVELGEAAQ